MKLTSSLILLLGVCLGACQEPLDPPTDKQLLVMPSGTIPESLSPADPRDFQDLLESINLPGLTARVLESEQNVDILLLEIDPSHYQPHIVAAPQKGVSARQVLAQNGITLLLGSGYAAHASSLAPVGLLKVGSQQLSPLEPYGYTRVLGFNDHEMGVVHRASYQTELFTDALQLGPGIIEDYQLDISTKDLERPKYFRSFAALCDNRWLIGATLAPSHLRTLGARLLSFFDAQGWRCGEVINFAGDRNALLAIKTPEQVIYHGEVDTRKVSFLGFEPIR